MFNIPFEPVLGWFLGRHTQKLIDLTEKKILFLAEKSFSLNNIINTLKTSITGVSYKVDKF